MLEKNYSIQVLTAGKSDIFSLRRRNEVVMTITEEIKHAS